MNARSVAMNPFGDVLAQAWDAISLAKDEQVTALWLLTGAKYLHELFRRRRPKKPAGPPSGSERTSLSAPRPPRRGSLFHPRRSSDGTTPISCG